MVGRRREVPPDDDQEWLAGLRRGGCTGRGWAADLEAPERTPLAEAVLGVAFLVTTVLAMYGLWCAARELFRLIH